MYGWVKDGWFLAVYVVYTKLDSETSISSSFVLTYHV